MYLNRLCSKARQDVHQKTLIKSGSRVLLDRSVGKTLTVRVQLYLRYLVPRLMGMITVNTKIRSSVNIRDKGYRQRLYESATCKEKSRLINEVVANLANMTSRPFLRDIFERCVKDTVGTFFLRSKREV